LKPRVLQFIDSFHQGGSEHQAIQLTRLLHKTGHWEVHLASLNSDGPLRQQVADLDLGEVPAYPLNNFYDYHAFKQLRLFVRHLRAARIDLLHTHDFYTNIFGMTAGFLARVPVRIASRRETGGMRGKGQELAQKLAYSMSHRIVANSAAVRQRLIAEGINRERITVIYNGLDLERMLSCSELERKDALERVGLKSGIAGPIVTIVANMRHAVKDYPMFLRAAQRVHEEMPKACFILAGEGELMEAIRGMAAELRISSNVYCLGRCENVPELLSVSDVCVLSSKAEGFSNSILEYMAAARPVVATDVGGAREAILEGETGFLVESGDDRSMAERIISLLREPARAAEMGSNGRQRVEREFSCEAQLHRTEALYESLLAVKTAPGDFKIVRTRQQNV